MFIFLTENQKKKLTQLVFENEILQTALSSSVRAHSAKFDKM